MIFLEILDFPQVNLCEHQIFFSCMYTYVHNKVIVATQIVDFVDLAID